MINILSMIQEDFPHVNAISINRHGKTLIKKYFNGYRDSDIFKVGCIFKSFVSAMAGIALQDNKIQSLDQRVLDFYPEISANGIDGSFSLLTLKHVMTKTSGICWPGLGEKLPSDMHEVFALRFKDVPGESFEYKPDPQIIVYLIEDLYGINFIDLINERLFKPLGIKRWSWDRDNIEGMRISVDDLSLFGQLYLNKGIYQGKQYFSEDFYYDSIYPHSAGGFPEGKPYGYYWWIDRYQDFDYFSACGFGGQKLCIIPSLDAAIVIVSEMNGPHPENNAIIRNVIDFLHLATYNELS